MFTIRIKKRKVETLRKMIRLLQNLKNTSVSIVRKGNTKDGNHNMKEMNIYVWDLSTSTYTCPLNMSLRGLCENVITFKLSFFGFTSSRNFFTDILSICYLNKNRNYT